MYKIGLMRMFVNHPKALSIFKISTFNAYLIIIGIILSGSSQIHATDFIVTNINDSGTGSFREAIASSNATSAGVPHTIKFNIPGSAPYIISVDSELPEITRAGTIIDATTQTGFSPANSPVVYIQNSGSGINGLFVDNVPNVEIYGLQIYAFDYGISVKGDLADGFKIGAAGKKNVVNRCSSTMVFIESADNGFIRGNTIGCDISGTFGYQTFSNTSGNGLYFLNGANGNTIGGSSSGEGNLIAGGTGAAVLIGEYATSDPLTGSSGNLFYGNQIGGSGTEMPFYSWGFWIDGNSDNNIIGGVLTGDGNNMSDATNGYTGNGYGNLVVAVNGAEATGNQIRGNNMSCAFGYGIVLASGGNNELAAPLITGSVGTFVNGTAPANSVVDLYTGSDCNSVYGKYKSERYLITTTANAAGVWSADLNGLSLPCPANLVAVASRPDDGSSGFSEVFSISTSETFVTGFSYTGLICLSSDSISPVLVSDFSIGGTWSADSGLTINPQTGIIFPNESEPGNYTVTYTVTASACAPNPDNTGTFAISLDSLPELSISTTGEPAICNGAEIELTASEGFNSYTWNGLAGGEQTLTVNSPGAYSVSAQTTNGCTAYSDTIQILGQTPPVANFSYSQTEGYVIDFTSTSENADTYLWDFGSGFTSTESNPSYNFLFDNTWPVRLIVSNDCGSDTIDMDVIVVKTGISELATNKLRCFEQSGNLVLVGCSQIAEPATVSIYSVNGQLVNSCKYASSSGTPLQIPLLGITEGIYFIQIQTANSVVNLKWVKSDF
jgi:hypothetical protein